MSSFFTGVGSDAELHRRANYVGDHMATNAVRSAIEKIRSALADGRPQAVRSGMVDLVAARGFAVDLPPEEMVGICAQHLPELSGIEFARVSQAEIDALNGGDNES